MNRFLLIIGILAISTGLLTASQASEQSSDESVEVISVSDGYKIIVPKGLSVEQKDGQIFVEDTAQFLLKRVEVLESQVQNMQTTLDAVSQALEAMSARSDERYDQLLQLIANNQI